MDYEKEIVEMLEQIQDEKALRCIYIIVSDIIKELDKK